MASRRGDRRRPRTGGRLGQQRLLDLAERARSSTTTSTPPPEVRRRRGRTTWLVGSAEEVAKSLRKYQDLGITHFILSDTPYLDEIGRVGDSVLPLLRNEALVAQSA